MVDAAHPPRLLTMNETAARLRVYRRTVKRFLDDGRRAFHLGSVVRRSTAYLTKPLYKRGSPFRTPYPSGAKETLCTAISLTGVSL